MVESPPNVPTIGEIARRFNARIHQVLHVIRSRNVQPIGRAGNAWIYSDTDVEFIGATLKRIATEREVGSGR